MMKICRIAKNKKGSAILYVVLVMLVLAMLGIAVSTMSIGTLQRNATDLSNNEAYYASTSGINSAIDHLKHEVIFYYKQMEQASGVDYSNLYNNFFIGINSNAQTKFVEPEIEDALIDTVFYTGSFDSQDNVCEFRIQCVSTMPDNASYQVNASVYIKKLDIKAPGSGEFNLIDNAAIISGDLLHLPKKTGFTVNGGDVIVSELTYETSWVPYTINGGTLELDPNIGDSVENILNYQSYSDPTISSPNGVADGDTSYNWGSIPASPVSIISTPGSDIQVNSCTIDAGVIHSQGDLHMNNGTFTVDLYADGDVHINNCTINGDIYCRGIFYGNNAVINGKVVSETSVDWHNGALNGSVYGENSVDIQDASGIGDVISNGPVYIKRAGINGGLVFSPTYIEVGDCSIKAVLYSCGDIEINKSFQIQGAVIAKESVYYDKKNIWFTVNYSPEIIESIMENTDLSYFQPESGQAQDLDSSVFVSEQVTTIGRIN